MINCEYTTIDTDKNRKQQSLHEKFFEVAAHFSFCGAFVS